MKTNAEMFNKLCQGFNKRFAKAELDNYERLVLQVLQPSVLKKVCDKVMNDPDIKFFPTPKKMLNIAHKLENQDKKTQFTFAKRVCANCDDIGIIPFVEYKAGQPYVFYGLACNCSMGMRYTNIENYFDVFPNFQFEWDRERYDRYIDCFDENFEILFKKWRDKNNESDELPF